ncbi:Uncharacterised protein [Mycolicibacterium fortuitum]|uniref:Uncharacterized protein n=1 Tax=Mycolicibacterium fortuitum TaxID=1766 RepID=A0A378UVY5_MYCFO|nr:Uncharacterised protein [Mycolicibacterium fortuitum]
MISQPASVKIWCGRATSSAQYPDGRTVPSLSVQRSAAEITISTFVVSISFPELYTGA